MRSLPQLDNKLESTLCWLSTEPLDPQRGYLLQHTTRQVSATISQENAWPMKVLTLSIVRSSFCMSWSAQVTRPPGCFPDGR